MPSDAPDGPPASTTHRLPPIQHLFADIDSVACDGQATSSAEPAPPCLPLPSLPLQYHPYIPSTPRAVLPLPGSRPPPARSNGGCGGFASPASSCMFPRPSYTPSHNLPALQLPLQLPPLPTPAASPQTLVPPGGFPPPLSHYAYAPPTSVGRHSISGPPSTAHRPPPARTASERDLLAAAVALSTLSRLSPPLTASSSRSRTRSLSPASPREAKKPRPSPSSSGASGLSPKEPLPRRFVCEHPECGAKFARKNDLVRHLRGHTGEMPFACRKGCGMEFRRSDARKRHEAKAQC
ncbi:hypothetical protein JCM10213_004362 [Rhodosporidiobolus nylandii]